MKHRELAKVRLSGKEQDLAILCQFKKLRYIFLIERHCEDGNA
jgi:hypothetical protein